MARMFPNEGCVVSLVDRLVHRSEVIPIESTSYRLKETEVADDNYLGRRIASESSVTRPVIVVLDLRWIVLVSLFYKSS
jgi:hypothetical protein